MPRPCPLQFTQIKKGKEFLKNLPDCFKLIVVSILNTDTFIIPHFWDQFTYGLFFCQSITKFIFNSGKQKLTCTKYRQSLYISVQIN